MRLSDISEQIGNFRRWIVRADTSTESLNNAGQIAFFYVLANGRQGIARADPLVTPVTEPGTLALLGLGLAGLGITRRRRAN